MQWWFLTILLATAVDCHILANGDSLEVHRVLGGAVTVTLEYPSAGLPIPNCCSDTKVLQQPVLAGAMVTEVGHLRSLGYLLRLDFVENIVACHLVPDVGNTNDLSSTLCPHLVCPAGWNLLQDTCFLVSQASGSWVEGQTFCQQHGGTLATITSNFQQVALSDMLTTDTWIGLRHQRDNHTYGWTDGSVHNYTSWAQDEGSISEAPDREECVAMSQRHEFLWNTAQCNEPKQYLCSIPAINPAGQGNTQPTTPTIPSTTTITPECESGWNEYQSSCYKVFKKVLNYTEATANCKALGGYLASITSEGEHSFLKGLVTDDTFIGLSDVENEGVFTWQDGSPFDFKKWQITQPNNSGNQDCAELHFDYDFNWNDAPCSATRHYVCEKSIQ